MVDTRTRNNSNTPCGSLSNTSISTLEQSGCQETTMLEDLPVSIWQSGPHPPQIPVVSVKQEPMDTEHDSHSPNNDSGISPDHGSSGSSSTGRPSPGQRGTFGSPEYFSVQESQGMRSEPNVESSTSSSQFQNNQHHITQNIPPIWEISLLALGGPGNPVLDHSLLKHTSETSEPDHPHQQPSRSPSSRNHITQNRTPTTSPLHCLKSFVTPISNRSHIVNHNTVCPVKTSPISTTNASSVLNTSLSDDNNSMSSSSSSTMVLDGRDENFKMTLPEEQQNPLRCLETAVEQSSIMGGKRVHGFAPGTGATNNGVRNIYQCPLCDYSTLSRADFNEHNKTHCPDQKCSKCDFVTKDIAELETHLSEHHMISPGIIQQIVEANEEQAGIRVPRVNSQGKVKTFRCKQCNFVAVTKTEFWNHSRQHIKKDKMLTCPRCPFVTEYKHHLEYHLRNHANSKPYECPHCSYICVNKSMLNSHLKSHSNVCQYRCATCKYETKYLHSLKVHLRKYEHSPAIVLNPDGTPNPDPIIDVYGTRRGPKQRPRNTMKSTSKENNNDIPFPYHAPPPVPIFQPSYQVIPQQPRKHPVAYPYGCIMPNAFIANNNSNSLLPKFPQPGVICTREQCTDVPDLKRNLPNEHSENFFATASQYDHMSSTNNSNKNNASGSNDLKMIDPEQSAEEQNSDKRNKLGTREEVMSCNSKEVEGDPLDLRKPDAMNVSSEASVSYVTPSILHKSTSMKTSKHRRKGQAYKLEQISWKLQQSNLSENGGVNRSYSHVSESEQKSPSERTDNLINTQHAEDNDIHGKQHSKQHSQSELMEVNEDLPKTEEESSSTHANNSASRDNPEVHHCAHCDIIFNDFLLYSMHKGYHGFQDPFTCNMCGVPTANKVDFFLHIARSSHS